MQVHLGEFKVYYMRSSSSHLFGRIDLIQRTEKGILNYLCDVVMLATTQNLVIGLCVPQDLVKMSTSAHFP